MVVLPLGFLGVSAFVLGLLGRSAFVLGLLGSSFSSFVRSVRRRLRLRFSLLLRFRLGGLGEHEPHEVVVDEVFSLRCVPLDVLLIGVRKDAFVCIVGSVDW